MEKEIVDSTYLYYSYMNTVIRMQKPIQSYVDIVYKMRSVVNRNSFHPTNMMIEDISECDVEDYVEYLLETIEYLEQFKP